MKNTSDTNTGQSITWVFDAEGQRAQKLISGGSWTLYVHDAFGQLAASYNNNDVAPACSTCYLTYDMPGSVPRVTNTSQSLVARHDFIPFGEEIPNGTAGRVGNFNYASNVTQAFTGQEEDGGTASLDFYKAWHYTAAVGSFMQPDPMSAGGDVLNPQSWNAYSYVQGNPLSFTDPSGAWDVVGGGLTQSPNTNSTRAQESFANQIGAVKAYPYAGSAICLVEIFSGCSGRTEAHHQHKPWSTLSITRRNSEM